MSRKYMIMWDAPTANEDGTQISDSLSYNLYDGGVPIGTTADTYFEAELGSGTHPITITAVNSLGNESAHSEVLTIEGRFPMPPTNLRVDIVVPT